MSGLRKMMCGSAPLALLFLAAPFVAQAGYISTFNELSPTPTTFIFGVDQGAFGDPNGDPAFFAPAVGSATGFLFVVPNLGCNTADFSGFVPGDIALIRRGGLNCFFSLKALNAQNAGAIGLIVYDNSVEPLPTFGLANYGDPAPTIPGVGITNALGLTLAGASQVGAVTVSISVAAVPEPFNFGLAGWGVGVLVVWRRIARRSMSLACGVTPFGTPENSALKQ